MTMDHHTSMLTRRDRLARMGVALTTALMVALLAVAVMADDASAEFGITAFDGEVVANEAGDAYTQAGGHPFSAATFLDFNAPPVDETFPVPVTEEDLKTVHVDLPPGLVGNPQALPLCEPLEFASGSQPECPAETQVGVVTVRTSGIAVYMPLFSLRPGSDDIPAAFGFEVANQRVLLEATVGPAPDYALRVSTRNVSQGLNVSGSDVRIWGTPADPANDSWRCVLPGPAGCDGSSQQSTPRSVDGLIPVRPFISLPTSCPAPGVGVDTSVAADSWTRQGVFHRASFVSHLPPGFPLPIDQWGPQQGPEGCDRLMFEPSVSIQPSVVEADSATGLAVDMSFYQGAGLVDPDVAMAAHLKRARVSLPVGMSINPAAADGLQACTDEQLGRFDVEPARCPAASKVGTVSGVTPILDEPLTGDVYVASQNSDDPTSGEMFRLFLVMRAPGLVVKLVGGIEADPQTGRLVTTFDNNPQYPVSEIRVRIQDGPRAPLATPTECGRKEIGIELTSWAGHVRNLTDSFDVPCPGSQAFDPGFDAGTESPTGGRFSPFVALIERPAGNRFLSGVRVDLPKGLVAKLAGVELCPDSVAGDGTPGACPAGSRIGTATVASGSGGLFHLQGGVFLTGPYQSAPYGLSVQVPVKAGPFDLGVVKVRQRIDVNAETAEVSIASDALPQIVRGVPVRLRKAIVDADRPAFVLNPTSCSEKRVDATLTAVDGQTRMLGRRFQAGDCQALGFRPKLAMRLTGRKQTRTGRHPGLKTIVTQAQGQAGIAKVRVALPKSIALDPHNSNDPELLCDYDASLEADCPASSVIGTATARTPVLGKPLTGAVHLVQGIKFGPTGNRIRTTPSLLVKLRGQVAINLRGHTTATRGLLITRFDQVPDAPVSRFDLRVKGGNKGILVVTRTRRAKINLCNSRHVADVQTDGHNGKRADYRTRVTTPCPKATRGKKAKRAKRAAKRVDGKRG